MFSLLTDTSLWDGSQLGLRWARQIEDATERDPAILHKNIQTRIETLLIRPFQVAPTRIIPFKKLIIIDGLDEYNNSRTPAVSAVNAGYLR